MKILNAEGAVIESSTIQTKDQKILRKSYLTQKTAQELRQRETEIVSNFHSTGKL